LVDISPSIRPPCDLITRYHVFRFDEMLNQMRKKTLKKRVQRKMSLIIGPGIEIGVNLYAMVRATRPCESSSSFAPQLLLKDPDSGTRFEVHG
jgi:hypothetical protein